MTRGIAMLHLRLCKISAVYYDCLAEATNYMIYLSLSNMGHWLVKLCNTL